MKIAKNKMVLAVLLLTVIASGCTGGSQEDEKSSTTAIEVNQFNAFPNPVPADQNTRFRMRVTNTGSQDAQRVYARLFNPPFATGNSQPNTWRDTSGNSVSVSERTMEFNTLRAGDDQTPAVPKTDALNLKAPDLGEDRDISYTFNSFLMFEYGTDATTEIEIMDGDRYREQGSPTGTATLSNSRGPVKLEIRTPTPIVLYDIQGTTTPTKELCILVRNRGTGVPFNHSSTWEGSSDGWNVSKIQSREHVNEVKIEVNDVGSIDLEASDGGGQSQWVKILGGQGVGCYEMEINNVGSTSIQRTIPLEFNATYGYRKSSSATVRVEGRP